MVIKRILTRKSIIGFGHPDYRELSVQMILDLDKPNFLINAYFNLGKIGFTDDILDELNITSEYRIEKPGKSYKLREQFYKERLDTMSDHERICYYEKHDKARRHRLGRAEKSDIGKRHEYLRAKNHGNL